MSLPQSYYVVNDFVLVQPAAAQEHKTPSGIITASKLQLALPPIPDSKQPDIIRGFVVRKGDGYPLNYESDVMGAGRAVYIPLRVEVGDEVYFMKLPPVLEIRLDGTPYFLIKQAMILVAQSQNE